MYIVKWTGSSKGYDDYIPQVWLAKLRKYPEKEHIIQAPHGVMLEAKCSLTVNERDAIFDYGGSHSKWNGEREIAIGQMRLVFQTKRRTGIPQVEWKDVDNEQFLSGYGSVTLDSDEGQVEGDPKLRTHKTRERSPALRLAKLSDVLKLNGMIRCEVCCDDLMAKYGDLGRSGYEVHHRNAIKEGERKTYLCDLAVLCANCHRAIHRTNPMQAVDAFAKAICVGRKKSRRRLRPASEVITEMTWILNKETI